MPNPSSLLGRAIRAVKTISKAREASEEEILWNEQRSKDQASARLDARLAVKDDHHGGEGEWRKYYRDPTPPPVPPVDTTKEAERKRKWRTNLFRRRMNERGGAKKLRRESVKAGKRGEDMHLKAEKKSYGFFPFG